MPCGFQSTLPVGGSDRDVQLFMKRLRISIHAPRGGSDSDAEFIRAFRSHFNPRSPWGERPEEEEEAAVVMVFQSTLPVGGATVFANLGEMPVYISIHAPRGGSDPAHAVG